MRSLLLFAITVALFVCRAEATPPSLLHREERAFRRLDFDLDDILPPEREIPWEKVGVNAFVNDPRYGTVRAQLAEATRGLGIRYVRVLFAWNDQVQSSPTSPINFSFYDDIARHIPRGVDALVVLTGLPSWMKDPTNWSGGDPRRTFVERWVTPVTSRYAKNRQVGGYQIWNEANMEENPDNHTLGVAKNPAAYVALLSQARTAVRRANRRKKTVMAATTAIGQNFPETIDYNKGLLEAGVERSTDVYAIHYYGTAVENVLRPGGVDDFMKNVTKPVWVTESGRQGILKQRSYVRQVWPYLDERYPKIRRIYYYQFTENAPADTTYGLKTLSPSPRVSDLYTYLRDSRPRTTGRSR